MSEITKAIELLDKIEEEAQKAIDELGSMKLLNDFYNLYKRAFLSGMLYASDTLKNEDPDNTVEKHTLSIKNNALKEYFPPIQAISKITENGTYQLFNKTHIFPDGSLITSKLYNLQFHTNECDQLLIVRHKNQQKIFTRLCKGYKEPLSSWIFLHESFEPFEPIDLKTPELDIILQSERWYYRRLHAIKNIEELDHLDENTDILYTGENNTIVRCTNRIRLIFTRYAKYIEIYDDKGSLKGTCYYDIKNETWTAIQPQYIWNTRE